MEEKSRRAASPAAWMVSPQLDPAGSEVSDFLLRLRKSNRALDRLRHALEGDEAEQRSAKRDPSGIAS